MGLSLGFQYNLFEKEEISWERCIKTVYYSSHFTFMVFLASQVEELTYFKSFLKHNGKLICINLSDIRFKEPKRP